MEFSKGAERTNGPYKTSSQFFSTRKSRGSIIKVPFGDDMSKTKKLLIDEQPKIKNKSKNQFGITPTVGGESQIW
jgi:hypothetical protein